ncbi:3-isopropylmalate/(R)-2-methylmalate dehydratase small subunit [Sphingobium faniae]|nr:3-isopropylmalate/(R)-2-methylmalate dehydratase small subunit [Sphingobium faniae]
MSEPLTIVEGIAAPLPLKNVDTDIIWPGLPGLSLRRGDQARNAFARLRFDPEGAERPDFILNQLPWREAKILVAGSNFGCGSSREMAVWGLVEWGMRCVIAPSFGDIFFNNACLNGLLPVILPENAVEAILATITDPERSVLKVDLVAMRVTGSGFNLPFMLDEHRRRCLLHGLNETGATLQQIETVRSFGKSYADRFPWTRIEGEKIA